MTPHDDPPKPLPIIEGPWTASRARAWRTALVICFLGLSLLGWLLVALIWLPLYMGLFFFIVAGLLVGACTFRIARPARPMTRRRILRGVGLVALACAGINLCWEYDQFARTAGKLPRFAEARNAAVAAGQTVRSIDTKADIAFRAELARRYSPGGPLGYVRWAVSGSDLPVTVDGASESIIMPHPGFRWLMRSLVALALSAIGLYLSFEALTSAGPVTNVLQPGEEYTED